MAASAASNEAKALELIDKADKKQAAFWPLGNSKYEDAEEMYLKAANLFKMAKKWQEAGDSFRKAADMNNKIGNKYEVATHLVSAAGSYKKCSTQDAVDCLRIAVEIYTDMGRFSIAAKQTKEIAEMYESEDNIVEAIDNYEVAASYYEGENSTSAANNCLLKVALFSAQLERYERAIEIFEQVAASSVENSLLKWNVKEHLLNAGLCVLASGEVHTAKRALEKYEDMDVTFSAQREHEFLSSLIAAVEEGDVEAFTQAVVEYDAVTKLSNWRTTILLRIKTALKEESEEGIL